MRNFFFAKYSPIILTSPPFLHINRWDRPNEEVAAALEARIQQANSQVDEAVQRRKEEFKREKQQQEDRDAQVAQLQVRGKHPMRSCKVL